ncbi:hypothetical protein SJ05684_c31490 [Sinorhizobium sojae CCBAU 05684]|uniref:Uncharacterized protein n=1 Tax=Sinorhizobium sojae CCBAU 05684 TaxID=716928 RepID=A0A249PF47_9HYPH|nr:hypothetical protein SJ05684_c31490 [Sinorhizobium sojae CCBAU 05684]
MHPRSSIVTAWSLKSETDLRIKPCSTSTRYSVIYASERREGAVEFGVPTFRRDRNH